MHRIHGLMGILLLVVSAAQAKDPASPADADTQQLLRRPEVEQIQISPDGTLLAVARRSATATSVSIVRRDGLALVRSIDPGKGGEVDQLRWLDSNRLLVGVKVADPNYGLSLFDPVLIVLSADSKDIANLPANFLATIDGDPDHILVSACARGERRYCLQEVRRLELGKVSRWGDLVIAAPDNHSELFPDRQGHVRFALGAEEDGTTRTYVHAEGAEGWSLINDSSKTGLSVVPLSVAADGKTGFLVAERQVGPDVIESYDFATGKRTEVYRHPDSDPIAILYSMDGREVIGARYRPTDPEAFLWNTKHPDAALLEELQGAFPGRLPHVVNATADGQSLIVYVDSDRDAGAFYLFDRAQHKGMRITRSRPWLDPAQSGSQQSFQFAARDGVLLHGLVTLPPGSSGKNLPTVVLVHGGPYGIKDEWGFDAESQVLARHGYAVVQVNFRGSAGYGREFADRGRMQWGRAMQDDVTDATNWAIGQGLADRGRICIYGASYGGYAALMGAIREPTLYRCAIGRSGVFDLAKLYKWGDIRRTDYGKEYLKRVLGEVPEDLAARSPAKLADKIAIPVLLAHGYLDDRAPVQHAQAMESAIKRKGGSIDVVLYPNMGHSLVLEAQQQDFYSRLLKFLDANTALREPVAALH